MDGQEGKRDGNQKERKEKEKKEKKRTAKRYDNIRPYLYCICYLEYSPALSETQPL